MFSYLRQLEGRGAVRADHLKSCPTNDKVTAAHMHNPIIKPPLCLDACSPGGLAGRGAAAVQAAAGDPLQVLYISTVHCTVYSINCTLVYSKNCTLYTVYCTDPLQHGGHGGPLPGRGGGQHQPIPPPARRRVRHVSGSQGANLI